MTILTGFPPSNNGTYFPEISEERLSACLEMLKIKFEKTLEKQLFEPNNETISVATANILKAERDTALALASEMEARLQELRKENGLLRLLHYEDAIVLIDDLKKENKNLKRDNASLQHALSLVSPII